MSKEELMIEHNKMIVEILKQCNYMLKNRFYMNETGIRTNVEKIADIAKYYFIEEPKRSGIDEWRRNNNGFKKSCRIYKF